jgi:hypothetical protein
VTALSHDGFGNEAAAATEQAHRHQEWPSRAGGQVVAVFHCKASRAMREASTRRFTSLSGSAMFDDAGTYAVKYRNFNSPALNPAMAAGSTADGHAVTGQALLGKIVACRAGRTRNYHCKIISSIDSLQALSLWPRPP